MNGKKNLEEKYHLDIKIDKKIYDDFRKSNLKIRKTIEMVLRKYLDDYNEYLSNLKMIEV